MRLIDRGIEALRILNDTTGFLLWNLLMIFVFYFAHMLEFYYKFYSEYYNKSFFISSSYEVVHY